MLPVVLALLISYVMSTGFLFCVCMELSSVGCWMYIAAAAVLDDIRVAFVGNVLYVRFNVV